MIFLYGEARGNGKAARRLYQDRFPQRPTPSHTLFAVIPQRLETESSRRGSIKFTASSRRGPPGRNSDRCRQARHGRRGDPKKAGKRELQVAARFRPQETRGKKRSVTSSSQTASLRLRSPYKQQILSLLLSFIFISDDGYPSQNHLTKNTYLHSHHP